MPRAALAATVQAQVCASRKRHHCPPWSDHRTQHQTEGVSNRVSSLSSYMRTVVPAAKSKAQLVLV